MKLLRGVV
jgi:hypothetical protein